MKELIDKAAVVKVIEKRIKEIDEIGTYLSPKGILANLLCHLNTLEVKEVDLEKEIELVKGDYEQVDVAWNNDFDFIANHFFELGLNAEKGE